jgi:hypothetical protein
MAAREDSPKSTRRRVWRFVFPTFLLALVAALWPVKGYRIDEDEFLKALGCPCLGVLGPHGATFTYSDVVVRETFRESRKYLEALIESSVETQWDEVRGFDVLGLGLADGGFYFALRRWNVVCEVVVYDEPLAVETSQEDIARECLDSICDGLEREIPGVTTFYNPPARQLWIDRVRPFLRKHFPKAFAP